MTPSTINGRRVNRPETSSDLAVRDFRTRLLAWYDQNRRELPWRNRPDPYSIWLSEIMLQQTRVAAVLEHYRLFLERFPDIFMLATAPEEAVLAAWSGLGYYRRARMLHQCARELVANRNGVFPQNSKELQKLPGIGRYTAAAIASIAFGESTAVVDGNVERVLERIAGRELNSAEVWRRAQDLLDPMRPGDFNQATMELGATVCLPKEPRCLLCPVREWCATRGEVQRTTRPAAQRKRQISCLLEVRNDEVRLIQRDANESLMAGMWELPQMGTKPSISSRRPWRTFRHSITVTDYTVHVFRKAGKPQTRKIQGNWIKVDQLRNLPLTGLARKVLKAGSFI